MAYQLASEEHEFLTSEGISSGRPPRRTKEPSGTIHALAPGASETVCGLSVVDEGLHVFDQSWPPKWYRAERCPDCEELAEDET